MNEFYKTIPSEEMFDYEDYYLQIVNWLPDNCRIVEVGIANGRSAIYLASKLEDLGKSYMLYAVDNMDYGQDNQLMDIVNNIIKSGVKNIELIKKASLDASCKFNDQSLDFVFIDASHLYEPTKADIHLWIRKLKHGGILAGHDYFTCQGVNDAVNQLLNPDKLEIVNTKYGFGVWHIVREPIIFNNLIMETPLPKAPHVFDCWPNLYSAYINLDSRPDRNKHMQDELKRVGINAVRRRGVLPEEITVSPDKTDVMMRRSPGAIGCWYSQVRTILEAHTQGKDALVMEDDLVFCDDIADRIKIIRQFLDNNDWDVFWLGGTYHKEPTWHKSDNGHHTHPDLQMCTCDLNKDWEPTGHPNIVRTYGAFSTHAYIVNYKKILGILELLDQNIYRSVGIDWCFILLQPWLKTFAFNPGCVKQYDNQSNIGTGITQFSSFVSLGEHWWAKHL